MSGYKPFLVPTVLSTERRNSRFLSAPTAQAQQGGCTRGAAKSLICRAVDYILLKKKMKKLYIVSKTRWGADYGSDHELFIAKFRLKLKKVGKTTRP